MTFAFDDHFAMFDITPVENQFLLEYMPNAKGDYVKVYLYGLLCCYHPREEMNLESMSRELEMSEEEILAAYRYWEKRGIVRRISDKPPVWQYVNIKQKSLSGEEPEIDAEYAAFSREIDRAFDGIRSFHGSELSTCYEWKTDMGLSTEVILLLLHSMCRIRGKNFKIRDAEKVAVRLAEEKALTVDEAAEVLSRDEETVAGIRRILRKLGKKYTPSDAQISLYHKWRDEWGFSHEAIEEACDQTGKSDPSLALVDAILQSAYEKRKKNGSRLKKDDITEESRYRAELKKVLGEIGSKGAITPYQEELYEQMKKLYPQEIVMMAARECAMKQKDFASVLKLLQSWEKRGFTSAAEIELHISAFHEKEAFIRQIRSKWNTRSMDAGDRSMELLEKWESELGQSRKMILQAADYAFEARKPLAYMDKLLGYWSEKGIRTPAAAEADRAQNEGKYREMSGRDKSLAAGNQNYEQRDYSGEQEKAMQKMIERFGEDHHA